MRISDWSSDVCSSDLLDALEYLAHDWRPGWIGKAVLDVPLGQSGQALLERIGSEPTGMVGQIVGDAVRCRRQVAAPFDLEVAHRGLVAATGVLAGRSEEHTSELQSLMRISYAVFCLKKKN